jgi:Protein of unknown function (DUF1570)
MARIALLLTLCVAGCGVPHATTSSTGGTDGTGTQAAPHTAGTAASSRPPSSATPVVAGGVLSSGEFHSLPWEFAGVSGRIIATAHYRVHTTVDNKYLLEQLPTYVEHALTHYTSAIALLPIPDEPFETYLLGTRKQWEAKTRQLLNDQAKTYLSIGRGGLTTRGIAVLYDIDAWGASDTLAITAHEGWHQYTQLMFQHPLPRWLEEGIATFMEGHSGFRRETPRFLPWKNRERFDTLRTTARAGKLLPLRELLRRSPESSLETGNTDLLQYYAQLWAFTHFLNEGENGKYHDKLVELLQDAAYGRLAGRLHASGLAAGARRGIGMLARSGPLVAQVYFNPDLAQLEAEYAAFVKLVGEGPHASSRIARGESPLTAP